MSYKILIVDDSPLMRTMMKKSIAIAGIPTESIQEAGHGVEALAILKASPIDLVFSDLHMPEMNGIELVEAMASQGLLKSIPVVIVSSDRSQKHIARLKEIGVRAYLTKPFRPEDISQVFKIVFGSSEGA